MSVAPAAPAAAADFVMKFGTATMNEGQHQFQATRRRSRRPRAAVSRPVLIPNSQLGPIPREIEGVQLGSIQGYIGPVDFFVGVDPRFRAASAPMIFRDDANAAVMVQDPAIQKAIFGLVMPKRMTGIATMSSGASDYGAKKPIMRLADFAGKKLRINGTELERQKMAKLGAAASACRSPARGVPFDQGTIDGTISRSFDIRRLQDERSHQGDHRHQRHLHQFDRRGQHGLARVRCRPT